MAQLTFYGAARTVTGSQYLLQTAHSTILVDCGLHQGEDTQHDQSNQVFPYNTGKLDAVVLTHAHIDHSGLLPRLVNQGYTGPIWTTDASRDLCEIMLPDSGHLQEEEVEWENKHRAKRHLPPLEPLYTADDARRVIPQFQTLEYDRPQALNGDLQICLRNAGHILGSACVEVHIQDDGKARSIVFSGDLGNHHSPLLKSPDVLKRADFVLMESTYGDKVSTNIEGREDKLAQIVNDTIERRGVVLIPAFAVGRAQDIVYTLHHLIHVGRIPAVPVYVDSPMAVAATRLYQEHVEQLTPEVLSEFPGPKDGPIEFPQLHLVGSVEESKALNERDGPAVIIAASGMCAGGRIRHHLINRIDDPRNTVLFVGYQAVGTLGRRIVEGAPQVDIMGKRKPVKARVLTIREFSAHADQNDLLAWYGSFDPRPSRAFIVHGEPATSLTLAHVLEQKFGAETHVPHLREKVEV